MLTAAIISFAIIIIALQLIIIFRQKTDRFSELDNKLEERARLSDKLLVESLSKQSLQSQQLFNDFQQNFDKNQLQGLKALSETLQKGLQITTETLGKNVDKLTQNTDLRLKEISGQVEKRLTEGFEKTNEVFSNILKRLALIDEAQKKITELSSNVVSLQSILADKRSRGAFGEVQLAALIRNVLPEQHFSLQHSLSNGTRADCMLFLPEPTGNIAIDAKFPLESYQVMTDANIGEADRLAAERQFRKDIKKHIQDIASKYIVPEETTDGAVMFIPAEAIFAEIHAHYYELVEFAQQSHVWMVSPTTMMAILTTSRAVIKDEATRKQVHIIQDHLRYLAKDFDRFQGRMDALARHIQQAHQDVEQVHTSAKKISSRFQKIEKVELSASDDAKAIEDL